MWICAYNDWYVPTLSRCMKNLIIYYYLAASSQLGPISRKVTLAFHSLLHGFQLSLSLSILPSETQLISFTVQV
jgi:hypothetical protein